MKKKGNCAFTLVELIAVVNNYIETKLKDKA